VTDARRARTLRVREDVHIHATPAEVVRHLDDVAAYDAWLAHHFHDYAVVEDDVIAFSLTLPLRSETARLRRDRAETAALAFVGNGDGDVTALTMAVHAESPREVHLTVEAAYRPAGGAFGGLLEVLLHRPYRTQALRESLWNLKQRLERSAPDAPRA
jgi:Polyketide cyclase / dehydrase and lipid transport